MPRSTIGLFNNLRTRQTVTLGEGTDVQRVENVVTLDYQGFGRGLNVSVPPSRLEDNFTASIDNFDINDRDELVRVPGIVVDETFVSRTPESMFVQGNPSTGLSELVFIDGNFLGVRGPLGGATGWFNIGLPVGPIDWASCIHGDLLILTNGGGASAFSKQPLATALTVLPWGPARTVMSFAGRVFAGGITDGATYAPMGVFWTGSSSEANDVGLGSGFEELLDDTGNGDQIVAMRSLNFGVAAILTRNAVWVARVTGNPNRPADFTPVTSGFGAVSNDTVVRVPGGVAYLSQRDVIVFDGNTPQSISRAINSELFPLDIDRISQYALNYVESRNVLQVVTPTALYEYSFTYGRWLRSSVQVRRIVNTGTEFAAFTATSMVGETSVGGWGEDWGFSWGLAGADSGGTGDARRLDTVVYLRGNQLGLERANINTFFGVPFTPSLETNLKQAQTIDTMVAVRRVIVEYRGAGGTIQLSVPDGNGNWNVVRTVTLPTSTNYRAQSIMIRSAGRQAGMRVALIAGSVVISRLQADVEMRSVDRQGGIR